MPQILNPPVYGASNKGLIAQYTLTFSGDLAAYLPLVGTWQGDPVQPVVIYIDNYNNGIPIQYSTPAEKRFIPEYTADYVDVRGLSGITLSASDFVTINIFVLNHPASGGRSRGVAPTGVSDPYWSSVAFLFHFDGNNNSPTAVDSKNTGKYIGDGSTPILSNGWSQFGNSSALCQGATAYNLPEVYGSQVVNSPFTWEFTVYPVTSSGSGNKNTITFINESYDGVNLTGALVACYETNGSNQVRFSIYHALGNGTVTLACATPYNYALNTQYQIAVTSIGGFALYVNGVQAASGGVADALYPEMGIFYNAALTTIPSGKFYLDELRLTLATRFTANYTPSGNPFPNQ